MRAIKKECQECGSVFFTTFARSVTCYPCYAGPTSCSKPAVVATRAMQIHVADLEMDVSSLQQRQRGLHRRIAQLEARLADTTSTSSTSSSIDESIRKTLVRQLHPDRASAYTRDTERLRQVLTQVFQTIQNL